MDTKGLPSPEDMKAYSKLDGGQGINERIVAEWILQRKHQMEMATLKRAFEHQQEMDVLQMNRTMQTLSYLTTLVLVLSFTFVVGLILGTVF